MKPLRARYVIVRTYSAGVHFGLLVHEADKCVTLTEARRIWFWRERNTLHEISLHGVGVGSRVSEQVARIQLTEAIEIIDCANEAIENLKDPPRWS